MKENEMESGFELVLDNRRLIAAFAVLIVICGAFFVLGYATGKRQGGIAAVDSLSSTGSSGDLASTTETGEAIAGDETEDLQWYQSANNGRKEPIGVSPAKSSGTTARSAAGSSGSISYSIQLGAFSTRQRAKDLADEVQSKGFESIMEGPEGSKRLYTVKVGRFKSREEGSLVQLDLIKNGYKDCRVIEN